MHSSDAETRLDTSPAPGRPPAEAFAPGFLFTDRYRIVALLGRGAMGEVYRAEDLRLGQPVALKFLPESMTHDPEARDRLFAEARNARSVAHPNVCRVYDVGEYHGRVFLTMEYIDGEDLASLLRRIGRLPGPKALEIARQLCAGLLAAHERGILHRDLKPSNVMIDGRGTVRLTDFGLAVDAGRDASPADFAGTMPYMAPERFRGQPATVQSDLYALGLILYETFTGERAFSAPSATLEEWRSVHDSSAPTWPSTLAGDVDEATERAILRCLEKDPARRPASAARVAASLPGGDPLAAALAAGQTPSPSVVAASGAEGTVARPAAWALLAAAVAALAVGIAALLSASFVPKVRFAGSPEVLRSQAKIALSGLGYENSVDAIGDDAWWFDADRAQLEHLAGTDARGAGLGAAASAVPSPLRFEYRQSPDRIEPENAEGSVMGGTPPMTAVGDSRIQLDLAGRFMYFEIVPPSTDDDRAGGSREPDWNRLFTLTGLSGVQWTPAESHWVPPRAADIRRAWTATVQGEPVRLEAAAYGGRIVFAKRGGAWNDSPTATAGPGSAAAESLVGRLAAAVLPVTWIVVLVSVGLLARRHVRLGRGDRRGALRVASVVLAAGACADLAARHWTLDAGAIWIAVSRYQGRALFSAALVWLCYLGLEPIVRRSAPHLLVAWARLIDGQWRDPLVGQSLLAGAVSGAAWPALATLPVLAAPALGLDGAQLRMNVAGLAPAPVYLSAAVWAILNGAVSALALVALMMVARLVLRTTALALLATALVATLAGLMGVQPPILDFVQAAILGVIVVWFLRRFGLLALAVALAVNWLIRATPWTLDLSAWFAWRAGLTAIVVLGLAVWGFLNVLGRQSPLPAINLDA